MARVLVISIAKIENDSRDRQIRNPKRPLQARLAHELHEKASVLIGKCGIDEVKQFQAYLTDYQINIVSKEHQNSIIFSGPDKEKRFICFCMIIILMSSQACQLFSPENGTVTPVKNLMIKQWIICVPMHVNVVVGFLC